MMKRDFVGEWILYDDTDDYTCSLCEAEWPKRFKKCPSCDAPMKNGIITFMEECDGREANQKTAH